MLNFYLDFYSVQWIQFKQFNFANNNLQFRIDQESQFEFLAVSDGRYLLKSSQRQDFLQIINNLNNPMENILQELQGKKCWKSFLKTQCRKNKISPQLVGSFTLIKFRKAYEKISSIKEPNKLRKKSSVWLQNQLKAFQWLLVGFTACRGILIDQCAQQQWKWLSTIFCKDEATLEYEAIKLTKQRSITKRPWERQQTYLLQEIIRQNGSNKWNEMARRLFADSGKKFFRSGKQCRERWYNHLDPDKKHGPWESTEDRKIASYILKNGPRWSQIAKALGNQRTQHMIKNRLKTLLIKLKKRYGGADTEEQLLQRFVKETEEICESSCSSEMLEVDDLPVQIDISKDQEELSKDKEETEKYFAGELPQLELCQPGTPNLIILHPLTPNYLNTPNSLTFLMNYTFDHFEQQQDLFFSNS